MSDRESREQEARDIAQEAAEAGVPTSYYLLGYGGALPDGTEVCETCGGDMVIDRDEPDPNIGQVAVRRPCPDCSMTVCRECRDGKHANCDGTSWNVTIDEQVECACDRC